MDSSESNAFEEISFDGFNMAHNGDIVFVSINHRLNIFGYLTLRTIQMNCGTPVTLVLLTLFQL